MKGTHEVQRRTFIYTLLLGISTIAFFIITITHAELWQKLDNQKKSRR